MEYMAFFFGRTPQLVDPDRALPGRSEPVLPAPQPHAVLGTPLTGPWREGQKRLLVGIGCFWGAEKIYWNMNGVESTSVGYGGGVTPNPTYREVCSGQTNNSNVPTKYIVQYDVNGKDPVEVVMNNVGQ